MAFHEAEFRDPPPGRLKMIHVILSIISSNVWGEDTPLKTNISEIWWLEDDISF